VLTLPGETVQRKHTAPIRPSRSLPTAMVVEPHFRSSTVTVVPAHHHRRWSLTVLPTVAPDNWTDMLTCSSKRGQLCSWLTLGSTREIGLHPETWKFTACLPLAATVLRAD
jgi:hypothetical protein